MSVVERFKNYCSRCSARNEARSGRVYMDILDDASTAVTPQYAATEIFKIL